MLPIIKKLLPILLAVLLLAGCGRGAVPAPRIETAVKQPVSQLVDELCEQYAFPMPLALDDQLVVELLGLELEQIAAYRGYISMLQQSPHQLIAVQAAGEDAEEAAKALQKRLESLPQSYGDDQDALDAIKGGQVFFYKDYAFLVVAGQPGDDCQAVAQEIAKKLEDNFEK